MPRTARKSRKTPTRETPSIAPDSDNDNIEMPTWDTSPNQLPAHLERLETWLFDQDPRYQDAIEYGWVLDRKVICCHNQAHVNAIKSGSLTAGTFLMPILTTAAFEAILSTPNPAPIPGPPPGPPPGSTPSSSPAAATASSAPTRSPSTPGTTLDRHQEYPEVIYAVERQMLKDIVRTVADRCTREDLKKLKYGSSLLKHLKEQRDKVKSDSSTFGNGVLNRIKKIEKAGIGAPRVAAFNKFRSDLTEQIATLPDDIPIVDSVLAQKLVRAARKLGTFVASGVDQQVRSTSARGDLALTVAAITTILTEAEGDAEDYSSDEGGAALLGKGKRGDPKRNGRDGRVTDDKPPWETRAWKKGTDEPCVHCVTMGKPAGEHWRKDCDLRDEAIAKKKAERAAKGNGKGNLVRGGAGSDASECESADDDDSADERSASSALFTSGRSSLLDLNTVDKPSDVLAAVRQTAQVARVAADGASGNADAASSSPAPAPASAPNAASAPHGRAAMARGGNSSADSGDSVNPVKSAKGKAVVPAAPAPVRKYYVVPNGERRGVYYGSWNAPDRIRLAAEGVRALGASVTSQKVTGISQAARFCIAQVQAGALRCSIFRGPHSPPDSPGLAIGTDVIVHCGLAPPEESSGPDYSPSSAATDSTTGGDSDLDAAEPRAPPPVPPGFDVDGLGPPPALEQGDEHVVDIEAAPPPPPPPPPAPPPPPDPAAIDHSLPLTTGIAVLDDPSHPLRVAFRSDLAELYRCSKLEGFSPPPGTKNYGKRDDHVHRVDGFVYFRHSPGKLAKWLLIQGGGGDFAAERERNPARGSTRLLGALGRVRVHSATFLSLAPTDDEDHAAAIASSLLVDDVNKARLAATEYESLADATEPPKRLQDAFSAYSVALPALKYLAFACVHIALAMLAMHLVPSLTRDPGAIASSIGLAATIASLPVLLSLLALTLGSALARASQAKLPNRVPRWRHPQGRGAPPRGPHRSDSSLQSKLRAASRQAFFGAFADSSGRSRRHLHRAAFAAVLLSPPELAAAVPACAALSLVMAFFWLGSSVIGCTYPPSSALGAASSPSCRALAPALRGGVCAVLRGAGGPGRLLRAAGYVTLLITTYTVGCSLDPTRPAKEPINLSFRARCEFKGGDFFATAPPASNPRSGRALLGRASQSTHSDATRRALLNRTKPLASKSGRRLQLVIDSGCTMSCHPFEKDLINRRPSRETMSGIDGIRRPVKCVGDMPIRAIDAGGVTRSLLIRNVRCVSEFTETLISVGELWDHSGAEARFADHNRIYLRRDKSNISFPFKREADGLFVWSVVGEKRDSSPPSRLALLATQLDFDVSSFHAPTSRSHVTTLSPDEMAAKLHHRLHLSSNIISKLPSLASDVPTKVSKHSGGACPHCTEANAARLSHSTKDVYKPSYVGRLIHADIVGPFKASSFGSYTYALVLVDDHSRYKNVQFLRRKSEALTRVRSFVSDLTAHVNRGKQSPTKIVGSLHTDNAGEFLSREFKEFLDHELIKQTTCPPHVHSLNGVAERAIRSIVENARANLTASACPVGFWPYAFEHSVNVLNRTTGPPGSDCSSFEILEGVKPKLLQILPFGCRAVAVRPRHQYAKRRLENHAWTGVNLGGSPDVTSGYRVWIPSTGKLVTTSDVYFDETLMPWRPKGDQRVGPVTPQPPPEPEDPPTARPDPAPDSAAPAAESLAEAYDRATRDANARARRSERVLILFSGSYSRPDGLGAFLGKLGLEVDMVDNDESKGGNSKHDMLNDKFYLSLVEKVRSGEYCAIFAAPPCSSFSISRFFKSGPLPVRDREHILGLPGLNGGRLAELRRANAIVTRTCFLLAAGWKAGTQFILENPVDRGDRALPRAFLSEKHGSIWQMPDVVALTETCGASIVHFSQCMIGAPWQKRTSLLYTAGFEDWLARLGDLECNHATHEKEAGGEYDTASAEWNSRAAAAYPPELNYYFAKAISSLHHRLGAPATPVAADARKVDVPDEIDSPVTESPAPAARDRPEPRALSPVRQPSLSAAFDASADAVNPSPILETGGVLDRIDETRSSVPDAPRPPAVATAEPSARDSRYWGPNRSPHATRRRGLLLINDALLSLSPFHGKAHSVKTSGDPRNRAEALAEDSEGWTTSMDEEMLNHESNGSWEWVRRQDVPRGRHLIRLIWVFKVKRDGRKKSRLCVQGCAQTAAVDYDQTFSAALRSTSLRVFASLAARNGLQLHRWDFVSAYLQGELEPGEVVYCKPPPGYERKDEHGNEMCCKVVKPVYGMAQAGRRWQRTLFPWLLEFGFKQSEHDSCLFHLEREMDTPTGKRLEKLIVGVYVDDLCCGYAFDDEHSLYSSFTSSLSKRWKVEDEGCLTDLLGIDFSIHDGIVTLKQLKYIEKIVATYLPGGIAAASQRGHLPFNKSLDAETADALSQSADDVCPDLLRRYQSLVGALIYCSVNTRPDVAYPVGMLCRAMSKPTPELEQAAHRVLRYLYRTRSLGLRFERSRLPLHGYSDSDWGVKHSTSGWVFVLNQAAIAWGSKKQKSVALSSCEAEIMAASEAAKEAVHLSRLAAELGMGNPEPTDLFVDNKSAIDVAYNPEHHGRMKHVDRRHFFVRELVEEHTLRVPYVHTDDNLADFLTKALSPARFFQLRDKIMNVARADRGDGGAL